MEAFDLIWVRGMPSPVLEFSSGAKPIFCRDRGESDGITRHDRRGWRHLSRFIGLDGDYPDGGHSELYETTILSRGGVREK